MSESGDDLNLSYAEALEELDEILDQLEGSAVDVDVLADQVARGAVLVRFCRQRLGVVRNDVTAVVDNLLDNVSGDAESDGPLDSDDAMDTEAMDADASGAKASEATAD